MIICTPCMQILRTVIGDTSRHSSFHFDASSYDDETDDFQDKEDTTSLNWTLWKTGIAFAHRDRTLLVLKQKVKESCPESLSRSELSVKLLDEAYRIEVHVYTNEWIQLVNELNEDGCLDIQLTPTKIIAYATQLLVMVSRHIKSLATNWFPGMLVSPPGVSYVTFVPCWKCYAGISSDGHSSEKSMPGHFIYKDMKSVHCFMLEENIAPAALGQDLECPMHSAVKCVHMVPDLVSEFENRAMGNLPHIITCTLPMVTIFSPSSFTIVSIVCTE